MPETTDAAIRTETVHDHLRRAREHAARGLLDRAERRVQQALALVGTTGDRRMVAACLGEQGLIDLVRGRLGEAEARLRAAEALGQASGRRDPRVSGALGEVVALTGRLDEGRARLMTALSELGPRGDPVDQIVLICRLGKLEARAGDTAMATAALIDARCIQAATSTRSLVVTRAMAELVGALEEGADDVVLEASA